MVVPPYFALVLRAFSVIEGIAMQHNGNYRIVGSCFPYLSQRLLTDDHPRMQVCSRPNPMLHIWYIETFPDILMSEHSTSKGSGFVAAAGSIEEAAVW